MKEATSNARVLASVSAILKNLLENGLVDRSVTSGLGGDAMVSVLPPDRVTTGADEKPQINLFLYAVTPKGLTQHSRYAPAGDASVPTGRALPPSLELNYLLSAYGAQDFQIELLLGYALEMLSETAILAPSRIREILQAVSSTIGGRLIAPALAGLGDPETADRFAQITISPQAMTSDESSKLWSLMQARYRPSVAYKVLVSLMPDAEQQ